MSQIWLASLPEHLRFSEENLNKQIAMHETSSNTGAWCFCFIHTLHPCYLLDLYEASPVPGSLVTRNVLTAVILDGVTCRQRAPSRHILLSGYAIN